MADRKALAIIGLILGGVTLATVTAAGAIVQRHLDGRLSFDEARSAGEAMAPSQPLRPVATQSARMNPQRDRFDR
jgi:hypothetical protein